MVARRMGPIWFWRLYNAIRERLGLPHIAYEVLL